MSDFYKIKEDMTEQHKKLMLDLKKIYDSSLADFKRQENEAQENLNKVLVKYHESLDLLKSVNSQIEKANESKRILDKELDAIKEEKENFETHRFQTEEGFKDKENQLAKRIQEINNNALTATNANIEREKELLKIKSDTQIILDRNEIVLSDIKKEREEIEEHLQHLKKEENDISTAREKLREDIKKSNELLNTIFSETEKNKSDKEKISISLVEIEKKNSFIQNKEKEQNELGEPQKDKDLEQDLREEELNSRQRKIETLIKIHNLKGV
jgi:chromosome segregation ATPase